MHHAPYALCHRVRDFRRLAGAPIRPLGNLFFVWGKGEKCVMHHNALRRRVWDYRWLAVGPIRPLDNLLRELFKVKLGKTVFGPESGWRCDHSSSCRLP